MHLIVHPKQGLAVLLQSDSIDASSSRGRRTSGGVHAIIAHHSCHFHLSAYERNEPEHSMIAVHSRESKGYEFASMRHSSTAATAAAHCTAAAWLQAPPQQLLPLTRLVQLFYLSITSPGLARRQAGFAEHRRQGLERAGALRIAKPVS